jgi:hypothetical protein
MDQAWDPNEDVPVVPKRGQHVPPPWFDPEDGRLDGPLVDNAEIGRFSWPRALGLLALVLVIIWVPLDFALNYAATGPNSRNNLALGFVWAVVIELFALGGLIRLMTRR